MRWIWGRNFLAALKAQQRQGASGIPAPAHRKQRRGEHGLLQNFLHGLRVQEAKNFSQPGKLCWSLREMFRPLSVAAACEFKIE